MERERCDFWDIALDQTAYGGMLKSSRVAQTALYASVVADSQEGVQQHLKKLGQRRSQTTQSGRRRQPARGGIMTEVQEGYDSGK